MEGSSLHELEQAAEHAWVGKLVCESSLSGAERGSRRMLHFLLCVFLG